MLFANGKGDLGNQAAGFNGHDAADQLVAPADAAKSRAAFGYVDFAEGPREEAIDFGFWNAVVSSGGFCRPDFPVVNPLL